MRTRIEYTDILPEGLSYYPDFLSTQEEARLLQILSGMEFNDYMLLGVVARRKVRQFGYGYEFYSQKADPGEAFPDWLTKLRDRAAPYAELEPAAMAQALVARYVPGAGIGWHRDAPAFGTVIVGISLASGSMMRFRRTETGWFEVFKQPLERRSLYVLSGEARSVWQHGLPPVKELRYSITFRTIRQKYLPQVS